MKLLDNSIEKDPLQKMVCLITGEESCVVETTTATMIPGSQATAKLVSFQSDSGYDSYGKTKGYNAPISEEAEFAYTTALNYLLRSDSKNKFLLGNRTFLFWASSSSESGQKAEESLWSMLGFQDNDDDPNRRILQVREVFNSIYHGQLTTSLEDKFYILGLAPNSARIAVTYWTEIPLKEFASMILKHFYDMDIIDTRTEKRPYFGLRSMLSSVTLGGKVSDVTPNLPEALVKSIFQGLPYPQTLYSSCIRRIRAENSIGISRAAIIKAYLNRLNNQEKINTMLDKENKNQGYLCGRLFAVLDKIQGDANGLHSIKERYMNAASATPATVFATIINLSSHHSEKLNERRKVYFEKLKQEIVDKISAEGFPSHLDLQDQGRFFVGFYHQQQDFYMKKEELNNDHE
jgi:CRISPR-associated protein Csd1